MLFLVSLLIFTRSITVHQRLTEQGQLFVALNWTDEEDRKYPTFRVFRSQNGNAFQSISTIDLQKGDEICNVLNVYPKTSMTTTYKYLNDTVIPGLTDQSAALKIFMEGGKNLTDRALDKWETFEPYGAVKISESKKQIINVTPVVFADFKKNPSMIWNYDVTMFGSWDAYADSAANRPNASELEIINQYLDAGYGVLLGHDTILYAVGKNVGFGPLAKRLNMKIGGGGTNDYTVSLNYFSTKVRMVRKGTLSQYPWTLNDTMEIPEAHTTSQFVTKRDDVWFEFYDGPTSTTSPAYVEANNIGNAIFYLTSTDNIAMIQTGHSCGRSSSDERKILANTLFYLKQRSSKTYVNDFNVVDEKKPDAPIEVSKKVTADTQKHIKLSLKLKGKDNGDRYDYVIKGYDTHGEAFASENTTINIVAGLKHFAYLFDDKPTTTADKLVNTATVVAIGGKSGAEKGIKGDIDSSTTGNNQSVVNGIVEGEGTIEIQNVEQFNPSDNESEAFTMYIHAACVDNKDLVSDIIDIAVDIDIPNIPIVAEQNKGNPGKKDNTGTIIGAVVGVVAGLAGAAAATALIVNACKPPIPIIPFWGAEEEEEEEEDAEDQLDLGADAPINPNENSEYYNVIQNGEELDPYENQV